MKTNDQPAHTRLFKQEKLASGLGQSKARTERGLM
jgi:hypothetical protein